MSAQLSGSFSIHSLVEGSEAISEVEEIQEVKHLQRRGDKAFHGKNYGEALRFYNDALEIDESNHAALAARAAVYIEMSNFLHAQQDAERLLTLVPNHAQGHYLLGVALDNLGQYRDGMAGFLSALELDTDPNHADILAAHIASVAHHFCPMPASLIKSIPSMDPYKKLCEVGACLYQAKRYDQCIKVLNAAQKVATNQKGITMKVQLTLANAHSVLKHTDIAISLYQECLSIALSTHDYQYQTKALVNIASLFLELGDTHRAIVHYEKLLDLEKEIRGDISSSSGASESTSEEEDVKETTEDAGGEVDRKVGSGKDAAAGDGGGACSTVTSRSVKGPGSQETSEAGAEAPLPAYWTHDLRCALHLNLSIAYKAVGSMEEAVHYARRYRELLVQGKKSNSEGDLTENNQKSEDKAATWLVQARSYHNEGLLQEILGEYSEALDSYKHYLELSKKAGDRRGVAQAYGCLGATYAALGNYKLALTYHDQHVVLAAKLEDPRFLGQAHEHFGDTRMRFKEYTEAVDCYMAAIKSCARNDLRLQTTALCKIGKAYRAMQRLQYSLYYFEQSKIIAEDFEFADIKLVCEFNLACILQHSTQVFEIDQAQKFFERLIPIYEAKIQQHQEEATFCPRELHENLEKCYHGIIHILAKSGYKEEALVQAEALHRKLTGHLVAASVAKSQSMGSLTTSTTQLTLFDTWSLEKINRVVSAQNATVLYYTLLPNCLLIWLLRPVEGIVRFYTSKQTFGEKNKVSRRISTLLAELLRERNLQELLYECENRALPERDMQLKLIRKANKHLGGASPNTETDASSTEEGSTSCSFLTTESDSNDSRGESKSADRALFDLLVAPVYDLLSQLEPGSPLIVVPDGDLYSCPFSVIKDWNQAELRGRFRITIVPSLFVLDRVTQNELHQLRQQDNTDFQRAQSKMGGVSKMLTSPRSGERGKAAVFNFASRLSPDGQNVDARQTSNPRLVKTSDGPSAVKAAGHGVPPASVPLTSHTSVASLHAPARKGRTPRPPPSTAPRTATVPLGSPSKPERLMSVHTMSTLTTKTATGTDICKAECGVTDFVQVSDREKALVIGSPLLPETVYLFGKEWKSRQELPQCQRECFKVADLLQVKPVVGQEATKDRFLQELQEATVIHIATMASLEEGLLMLTPNVKRHEQGAPLEHSYLVNAGEVANLTLSARLVVLSGGWGAHSRTAPPAHLTHLPTALLAAGAQCVLTLMWAVPDATLLKFYHHFYQSLQEGSFVSVAVAKASKHIQADDRYGDLSYWAPYSLIGKDVEVDLRWVQQAMLDQTLNRIEKEAVEELTTPPLNPEQPVPKVPTLEEQLASLQSYLGDLLILNEQQTDVLPQLITLLDGALKRLHMEENNQKATQLPECIANSEASLRMLKLLGFHFQGKGASLQDPYVIYPHWNPDNLLVPTYDALRAVLDVQAFSQDLVSNPACARALYEFFPGPQDMLSYIIDVLCITKHAPEIQLKVSDMSVRPLWRTPKVKAILVAMGFHQIGPLLNFNNVPSNWRLLNAALQLLISVSAYKSTTLLHKLDVTLLGGPHSATKTSNITFEQVKLPSLSPVILPRQQLRMSTPWMSTVERTSEMEEKMRIARSKTELMRQLKQEMVRAKSWHQLTLASQANESLAAFGRAKTQEPKVKVMPGSTSSFQRIPCDQQPRLGIHETDQRRDYATFLLRDRIRNVAHRYKDDVRKMYTPYAQNVCTN